MKVINLVTVCVECSTVVEGSHMDEPCPKCETPMAQTSNASSLAEMARAYEEGEVYNES